MKKNQSTGAMVGMATAAVDTPEVCPPVAARLILAATDKGHVGKSYVFKNMIQWLKEHPLKPGYRAFDLDKDGCDVLKKCHPEDPLVAGIDLTEDAAMDVCVRVLGEEGVDVSVVDGRGGMFDTVVMPWAR